MHKCSHVVTSCFLVILVTSSMLSVAQSLSGVTEVGQSKVFRAGTHDNPFGMRLTPFTISKKIVDTSVPMSLLADHEDVEFHYYRHALKSVQAEMH